MKYFGYGAMLGVITCLVTESVKFWKEGKIK